MKVIQTDKHAAVYTAVDIMTSLTLISDKFAAVLLEKEHLHVA
jgi:hypothetical protein